MIYISYIIYHIYILSTWENPVNSDPWSRRYIVGGATGGPAYGKTNHMWWGAPEHHDMGIPMTWNPMNIHESKIIQNLNSEEFVGSWKLMMFNVFDQLGLLDFLLSVL